jgi:hypothetical protein
VALVHFHLLFLKHFNSFLIITHGTDQYITFYNIYINELKREIKKEMCRKNESA